jgi:hypothetical protein
MNIIGLLTNAKKKMDRMLDDFNRALPAMKALGLSVSKLDLKMGWIPSISATLRGSFKDMDAAKIKHLRESQAGNKVLAAMLRALETAANVKTLLQAVVIEGIEVRVRLGLNFGVDVGFIPPASGSAASDRQAAIAG